MHSVMTPILILLLGFVTFPIPAMPSAPSWQSSQGEEAKQPGLSSPEISRLHSRAEAGEATAQTLLGKAYREGNGVPQNDALAVKWFRKAADQGDATAENNLGIMYRMGEGVERDKVEAVRWFKRAAYHGDAKAMFNLGASYYNGDGVGIDDVISYAWFLLAREAGNAAAHDALRRAVSERAAAPSEAFVKVAQMYETGQELPQNMVEALAWYRKAADAGHVKAAVKVSSLLLANGRKPTPEDYTEARHRCEDAAKRYSSGAYCVALIYGHGIGVTKDAVESAKWLNRAADMGHARAALELGEAYWKGERVKPDLVDAYMWVWLAYNSSVTGAEQDEQELRKEMNAKQVDRAKQKASEWSLHHKILGLRPRTADSESPTQ